MGADIIVSFAESQRETKKIVAKKKQQSKNDKQEFFLRLLSATLLIQFDSTFFYAPLPLPKRQNKILEVFSNA